MFSMLGRLNELDLTENHGTRKVKSADRGRCGTRLQVASVLDSIIVPMICYSQLFTLQVLAEDPTAWENVVAGRATLSAAEAWAE